MRPLPALARATAYGLAGSLVEGIFTSAVASAGARHIALRGPSTPWMLPIYGLAMPLFEPVHDRLREWPIWVRALAYAAGVLALEAGTGWLFRRVTGRVPWAYERGLAVAGLIRLDYAPGWALLGLATERLHDLLAGRPRKLH